ncbi:sodium-dependent proline transporter-like [Lineus longissimus]|uniref:sodium-dependent proline transporter-like n=1 Tax=Lineus longissimus TaxID=88925 RepID=UPI002B4F9C53
MTSKRADGWKTADEDRKHWDSHFEFLLTLLGGAVGLGNIWRFPYLCMRNGGGAFLIPYIFAMVVIGFPSFFLELAIGQFSGLSPSKVWNVIPLFTGMGWGMAITIFMGSISYGHLLTWILYYLGMSFSPELPWASCNNTWNTENCFQKVSNYTLFNATVISHNVSDWDAVSYHYMENATAGMDTKVSPGEEFLRYNVLELTASVDDLGGLRWQLVLCHLAWWTVACLCLIKGVQSVGKVAYVTAIAPYVLLTVLLIRGCLLPGAVNGIIYYIKPEWSKLLDFRIWVEAAFQIFYSTGVASGSIITFSSYNKFKNNCQRDTFFIVIANSMTSIYAGFAVFAVIGYMAQEIGMPVDQVIKSGPGLAFIVYPEALSKLPLPQLWSVLFFLMLTTLGIGTTFALIQTVLSSLTDAFPKKLRGKEKWILLVHCIVGCTVGLIFCTRGGMYWFQLVEWYAVTFGCCTFVICEFLGLAWLYGLNRFYSDIEMMIGKKPYFLFKLFWGGLTPCYVLVIFIYFCTGLSKPSYAGYEYPDWATGIAAFLSLLGIISLVAFAAVGIAREEGNLLKRLRILTRPNESWGPQDPEYREQYAHQYGPKKDVLPLDAVERNGKAHTVA